MNTWIKMTGIAAVGLFLGGCAHDCITVASASSNGGSVSTKSGDIGVSTSSSRLLGNLLNAKVQLTNKTSDMLHAKYRFQWFSHTGFNEGEPTPWTPIALTPRSSKVVSQVAPTSASNNFNILVCQ